MPLWREGQHFSGLKSTWLIYEILFLLAATDCQTGTVWELPGATICSLKPLPLATFTDQLTRLPPIKEYLLTNSCMTQAHAQTHAPLRLTHT